MSFRLVIRPTLGRLGSPKRLRALAATVLAPGLALLVLTPIAAPGILSPATAQPTTATTAWQDGQFVEDTADVVSESDIVLGEPNTAPAQSLPLGNGSLGVAEWAANGFTAQLNRNDTMPYRLSPGQVISPGGLGETFGAMAAITAGGQDVSASVVSSTEVQVSFDATSSGTFRVVVASPGWTGGNAITTAQGLIGPDATTALSTLLATQASWWGNYWAGAGLVQATSSDGSAQYMEDLRTLYLYDDGLCVDTPDASTASGVQLQQYTCNGTPAQAFNLVAEG